MQQTELKNLVFERFEQRRLELVKKRNRFQQELDQDLHQLRESYGDTAVLSLGELTLTLNQPKKAPTPTEPAPAKKPRSRRKRHRSNGEPSIKAAVKKKTRVNWTAAISTALQGEPEGLKLIQLMARLRKAGIPAVKAKGPGFHGVLSRLVDRGTVKLENNLYRLA